MASLKEVKTRINSVKSTRKITSAMKMVASAKLHKAQGAIENMLPYQKKLNKKYNQYLKTLRKLSECGPSYRISLRAGARSEACGNCRLLFEYVSLWCFQCQCDKNVIANGR